MLSSTKIGNTAKILSQASILELEMIAIQLRVHVGEENAVQVASMLRAAAGRRSDAPTTLRVQLHSKGHSSPNYVQSIKVLRALADLPLKEAKAAMDGVDVVVLKTEAKLHELTAEMRKYDVTVEMV